MEIASRRQLRFAYLRWAVVTVPLIMLLGFVSSRLSPSGDDNPWYAALAKPAATPPGWVFPIAWGLIYILLGLALAMILHARGARLRGVAIGLFVAQMVANLAWSPLYFGGHRLVASFVLLIVIFVLALATTLVFARVRSVAGWLMVPYLAWLCFAGSLTWDMVRMNPNADAIVPNGPSAQIAI